MERQIRFRAWLPSEKKMERDRFYINQWDGKCHYTEPYHYEHEDKVTVYDCGEEEPILMQFTGLKDKNGVEIYEGDIILFADKYKYEVLFEDAKFVCYHVKKEYGKWGDLHRLGDHDFSQFGYGIVGNIYENPELLQP